MCTRGPLYLALVATVAAISVPFIQSTIDITANQLDIEACRNALISSPVGYCEDLVDGLLNTSLLPPTIVYACSEDSDVEKDDEHMLVETITAACASVKSQARRLPHSRYAHHEHLNARYVDNEEKTTTRTTTITITRTRTITTHLSQTSTVLSSFTTSTKGTSSGAKAIQGNSPTSRKESSSELSVHSTTTSSYGHTGSTTDPSLSTISSLKHVSSSKAPESAAPALSSHSSSHKLSPLFTASSAVRISSSKAPASISTSSRHTGNSKPLFLTTSGTKRASSLKSTFSKVASSQHSVVEAKPPTSSSHPLNPAATAESVCKTEKCAVAFTGISVAELSMFCPWWYGGRRNIIAAMSAIGCSNRAVISAACSCRGYYPRTSETSANVKAASVALTKESNVKASMIMTRLVTSTSKKHTTTSSQHSTSKHSTSLKTVAASPVKHSSSTKSSTTHMPSSSIKPTSKRSSSLAKKSTRTRRSSTVSSKSSAAAKQVDALKPTSNTSQKHTGSSSSKHTSTVPKAATTAAASNRSTRDTSQKSSTSKISSNKSASPSARVSSTSSSKSHTTTTKPSLSTLKPSISRTTKHTTTCSNPTNLLVNPSFEALSTLIPSAGNFAHWSAYTTGPPSGPGADLIDISSNEAHAYFPHLYPYDFTTPFGGYAAYILPRSGRVGCVYQTVQLPSASSGGGVGEHAYTIQYSYHFAHAVLNTTSVALRSAVRYGLHVSFAGRVVDALTMGPEDVAPGWVTRSVSAVVDSGAATEADLEIAWGMDTDPGDNAVWSQIGIDDVSVVMGC